MLKRTFILLLLILAAFSVYRAWGHFNRSAPQKSTVKAAQTSITFLEGWDTRDISNYLEKNQIISKLDFSAALKNFDTSNYLDLLSKPKSQNLEGFLFPDTYFIPAASSAAGQDIGKIIVQKALDNFSEKITPEMNLQASLQNMSLYQIITLASIIEKESGNSQEDRKMISQVFYNRLKIGMALESDATVNFITGKKDPGVSLSDSGIDSPYNTYKYPGLPPGPICNPGLDAIMAALYPTDNNYVYFLTIPETRRAVFARTYEEHLKNKQKYLK